MTRAPEFDVQPCTRVCARTGRPLADGETFYAVLVRNGAEVRREDYCLEGWPGPNEAVIGWWRARVPNRESRRPQPAPNEVLLQLFDELADRPEQADVRYVLALWLVRRRLLQLVEAEAQQPALGELQLFNPKTETTHQVPIVEPDPKRAAAIQSKLSQWLFPTAT